MTLFSALAGSSTEFMEWGWEQIEPYYQDLQSRQLDAQNAAQWLSDWTRLMEVISETYARLGLANNQDTANPQAEAHYNAFLDEIYIRAQAGDQGLKEKLLASELDPPGFELPLRRMRTESAIFRTENLALLSEERKLASEYNKIIGSQTVTWEDKEQTLQRLRLVLQSPNREIRERAWRLAAQRQLADRESINATWQKLFSLRMRLTANAGMPDYRAYRWAQMLRLDYTPEDCVEFQQAIEQVAVPAASRVYARHARRLEIDKVRPWDLDQDLYPLELPALPTYGSADDLEAGAERIFMRLDPKLGAYYHTMRHQGLLDLTNRKGKAPGAYCTSFPITRLPFVFMNAVGLASDVRTMLHESGHAFHNFERLALPYFQQRIPGLEFAEVASLTMELLTLPFIDRQQGGFYNAADAQRYRNQQIERLLLFWPYMAVVDAFQHWAYTHPELASAPTNCDACWLELWQRYLPAVNWSGLEAEAMTGWHRKQHIYRYPFYYVEYGVAQLGAVQVWRNALNNPRKALADYLAALRLGGTVSLPQLYAAAGAKFTFDAHMLSEAVQLIEQNLDILC